MVFGRKRDEVTANAAGEDQAVVADILSFLAQQGLPANPINYELGYLRQMDGESLAARAIDAILISGARVSQEQADQIVSAYRALGGGSAQRESDEEAPGRAKLRHQTLHLAELTADAMTATGQFGRDLSTELGQMDRDRQPIAATIAAMIDRSAETEQRLSQAMEQIDALHAEVAAAKNDAARDELTGLVNRRGLQERFDALGDTGCVSLAICDIDRFKTINDRYGHQVGDRVIKAVAGAIADSCEPHVVARWGGEEFIVLMEGVPLPAAMDIIQRANSHLQNRSFRIRDTGELLDPITFSAGVVTIELGQVDQAIRAADALLYRAKTDGRNMVLMTDRPALAA